MMEQILDNQGAIGELVKKTSSMEGSLQKILLLLEGKRSEGYDDDDDFSRGRGTTTARVKGQRGPSPGRRDISPRRRDDVTTRRDYGSTKTDDSSRRARSAGTSFKSSSSFQVVYRLQKWFKFVPKVVQVVSYQP